MIISIIDDDENKQIQISTLIKNLFNDADVILAKSYHSGLSLIVDEKPELVLLDMTMPTYDLTIREDGGRPRNFAGKEILNQIVRRNIDTSVFVITQFDVFGDGKEAVTRKQLDESLKIECGKIYHGMIYYNATTNAWKEELTEKLKVWHRSRKC